MQPARKSELLLRIQKHIETIEGLEARLRQAEVPDRIVDDYTRLLKPSLETDLNEFLQFVPSSDPDLLKFDSRLMVTYTPSADTIGGQLESIKKDLNGLVARAQEAQA